MPDPKSPTNVRVLSKGRLGDFLVAVGQLGELHAPLKREGSLPAFGKVNDAKSDLSNILTDYVRTQLPLKKYLFAPEQELYRFSPEEGYVPVDLESSRKVIFGVHPCDIRSLGLLDRVFLEDYHDRRYDEARRDLVIIGISCVPDENCFCNCTGNEDVSEGYDLFLTDIGDAYFVRVGTSAGEDIVRSSRAFEEVTPSAVAAFKAANLDRASRFVHGFDIMELPVLMPIEYWSGVWEEIGGKCLNCGGCSLVCPTCYCYDVYDSLNLDARTGKRIRRWDSCNYRDFALVAGGHNFRPDAATRLKMRYVHKHVTFVEEYGRSACVGCGRCIVTCPANISITDVVAKLRGEKVSENAG